MATEARKATLARWIRSAGGRWFRKLGLLPPGVADGLGDDAVLAETALSEEIVVYFPDPPESVSLLRQWYPTLRVINRKMPVVIVVQDSRTKALVLAESQLPTVAVAHYATMDSLLSRSMVRAAVYVSDHPWNFSMLRFSSIVHVLLVKDSGQAASISNQVKGYDFCFTTQCSGAAEIFTKLPLYDASRCKTISISSPDDDQKEPDLLESLTEVLTLGAQEWERVRENGAIGP